MLNLFVLIIIDQFEENYINTNNPLKKYRTDVEKFKEIWVNFTKENFGLKLNSKFLINFLLCLDIDFNFGKLNIIFYGIKSLLLF